VNLDHYTYRVTWSPEDGEHVGLCVEFPSLSWLAPSPEEALFGIRQVVSASVRDMQENGENVPRPMADREYSGKFQVRVPPAMHRELSMKAAEEGVSLNRFISSKLAV
jgi:predicted HicB family RNase H-like nuclease